MWKIPAWSSHPLSDERLHLIILLGNSVISPFRITMNAFKELLNHLAFGTAAALKESNYLQGCKHTLCLGGICLDNWEKWRGLLLVPSPTFHIDLQVSLQNCFSLKYTQQENEKSEKCKLWRKAYSWREDVLLWWWRLPAVSFLVAPDNPIKRRLATTGRTERQIHLEDMWYLDMYWAFFLLFCLFSAPRMVESARKSNFRFWVSCNLHQHYANAKHAESILKEASHIAKNNQNNRKFFAFLSIIMIYIFCTAKNVSHCNANILKVT